jgi:imidazolonepropionase-like amidohydrolase
MHRKGSRDLHTLAALGVLALFTACLALAAETPAAEPSPVAVVGARVFDGERVLPRATVIFSGPKILLIAEDAELPAGALVVDGAGKTLLPGLIDAHTHAFGDALERALAFGVTTELDMFTSAAFASEMRRQQRAGAASHRADLYSAGTLLTAPGGHGTQFGVPIPTLSTAAEAEAFVAERLAEGSDYIKLVYDDGATYGLKFATLDLPTLSAAIAATRKQQRLALVHPGSRREAREAIEAGAHGLVHLFADEPLDAELTELIASRGVFVIPTLSVNESAAGVASGQALAEDERLRPHLSHLERESLRSSFPMREGAARSTAVSREAAARLHAAGVPLLAGSDAPNPGTAHGVSLHRELALLVEAGLTPVQALAAATSVPARVFALADRGRIAPGLKADLLLVDGDPTADIQDTLRISAIWKDGRPVERPTFPDAPAKPAAAPDTEGLIADFEASEVTAAFGMGWTITTDQMMGGSSTAEMQRGAGGVDGSSGRLDVTGEVKPGSPFPWAGVIFFPGQRPMEPVDLSGYRKLAFWAKGDGGTYSVLFFASRFGRMPVSRSFTASERWQRVEMELSDFRGMSGEDVTGLAFTAGAAGTFAFSLDEVRLLAAE